MKIMREAPEFVYATRGLSRRRQGMWNETQ
jgi:hypothetical protein